MPPPSNTSRHLGYSQAPIVVVNDHHHWSGFNPTEIERLKLAIR
ncbi:hypothetical protein [Arthrobacter psychrolactophilus]